MPTRNLFINLKISWLLKVKLNIRFKKEYIKSTSEKFLKIKYLGVFSNINAGGNKYLNEVKKLYKNIVKTSNSNISIVILSANWTLLSFRNKSDTIEYILTKSNNNVKKVNALIIFDSSPYFVIFYFLSFTSYHILNKFSRKEKRILNMNITINAFLLPFFPVLLFYLQLKGEYWINF